MSVFRNTLSGPTCHIQGRLPKRVLYLGLAYLLLRDLHVQDNIVNQLRQGFLNSAFEFAVFQKSMDKFENAKDEIFEAQHFTYRRDTKKEA